MPFQFYCPQGHLLEGHESQAGQQSQCPLCGAVFVMPGGAMPQAGVPAQQAPWPGYAPGYPPQPMPGYPPPGFGQPAPGFGQPAQAYGPQGAPAYPGAYPGYPPGYGGAPGQPVGVPPGYGQQPMEPGPFGPQGLPAFAGHPAASMPETSASNQEPALPTIRTEEEPTGAAAPAAPSQPSAPAAKPEEEKKEPRIVRIPCPQGHELQTPTDMLNQEVLCPICSTQFHLRYEDSVEFKEEQAEQRRRKAEQLNQAALKWSIIAAVVIVLSIVAMVIYLAVRTPADNSYAPREQPNEGVPADTAPADTTRPATSGDSENVTE